VSEKSEPVASRVDTVQKIREILGTLTSPSDELIATGKALVAIGEALRGLPVSDAKAALAAVITLEGK
jgi:hypothetical protein